jgi:probable H4MPT-linked C1 transfer pathway protein
MHWLGLDVGGANLKLADGRGWAASRPFPLWRQPERLAAAIAELLPAAPVPTPRGLAVTMTGELADCFTTKREGVQAILEAAEAAAAAHGVSVGNVRVYLTTGEWASVDEARRQPLCAAAANWHALARYAGRLAPQGPAILIDVGSTTTDLVPLTNGLPSPQGWLDPERLAAGELVYTGVQRSPICALLAEVRWRGVACPVAQELFATTWDAYLTLGELPEEPENTATADGRPATKAAARDRLARMLCADRELFDEQDAQRMAIDTQEAQLALLERAARRVLRHLEPPQAAILSGIGEFLARRLLARLDALRVVVSLTEQLGPVASRCAPAHALAVLANEEAGP